MLRQVERYLDPDTEAEKKRLIECKHCDEKQILQVIDQFYGSLKISFVASLQLFLHFNLKMTPANIWNCGRSNSTKSNYFRGSVYVLLQTGCRFKFH